MVSHCRVCCRFLKDALRPCGECRRPVCKRCRHSCVLHLLQPAVDVCVQCASDAKCFRCRPTADSLKSLRRIQKTTKRQRRRAKHPGYWLLWTRPLPDARPYRWVAVPEPRDAPPEERVSLALDPTEEQIQALKESQPHHCKRKGNTLIDKVVVVMHPVDK